MKFWHKVLLFLKIDLKAKFFSVVIACFLWYYVNIFSIEKSYISLPVEIINVPEDTIIEHKNDLVVKVEILSREDISRHLDQLSAVIDLTDAPMGTKNHPILLLKLPKDITVNIIPTYLRMTLTHIIQKTVPVNVMINPHISQTNMTFGPKEVTISGSDILVNEIQSINTDTFGEMTPTFINRFYTNLSLNIPEGITILDVKKIAVNVFYDQEVFTNQVFLPTTPVGLSPELSIQTLPSIPVQIITKSTNIEKLLLKSEILLDLKNIESPGLYSIPIDIVTPENTMILNPPKETAITIIANKNVQNLVIPTMEIINESSLPNN